MCKILLYCGSFADSDLCVKSNWLMINSVKVSTGESNGTSAAILFRCKACYWWSKWGDTQDQWKVISLKLEKPFGWTWGRKKTFLAALWFSLNESPSSIGNIYFFSFSYQFEAADANLCPQMCRILSRKPCCPGEVKLLAVPLKGGASHLIGAPFIKGRARALCDRWTTMFRSALKALLLQEG